MQEIYFEHIKNTTRTEPSMWKNLEKLSKDRYLKAILSNHRALPLIGSNLCLIAGFGTEEDWSRVVGFLGYTFKRGGLWISTLRVDTEFAYPNREEKIGSRMLKRLVKIEKPQVIRGAVNTPVDNLPSSLGFWLKMGYRDTGEKEDNLPIYRLEYPNP